MKVQQFLAQQGVAFDVLPHDPTFSAQRMAEAVHVCGDNVAKTVLLKTDDGYVVAVLPATHQLFIDMVRDALESPHVRLADAREMAQVFADCEYGVVPPFGSQYGLMTLVDVALTEDDEIVFEGNAHREAIRMKYQAYEELEQPRVAVLSYHVCS